MTTTRDTQSSEPLNPDDPTLAGERVVEVQEVVTTEPQPIPPEFVPPHPGGPVDEPLGPRVVTENENVRVNEDGSVSRTRRPGRAGSCPGAGARRSCRRS